MRAAFARYLMNIALACASLAVGLGLLEIGLRFTHYRNLLPITQVEQYSIYLEADPVKGYDIREDAPPSPAAVDDVSYEIWSNDLGCFDLPYRGETGPVLLVGDSFTFAFAPFQDKWGTKLEGLLERRVLKCGVGGYGTRQELLKASEVISRLSHPPRLIVVGYFVNDLEDDYLFPHATILDGCPVRTQVLKDMEGGEIVRLDAAAMEEEKRFGVKNYPHNRLLKRLKRAAERYSVFYHLTKDSLRPALLNMPIVRDIVKGSEAIAAPTMAFSDRAWLDRAWETHFSNLGEFKALAERQGARLLVVIIPYREQVYPFLTSWRGIDRERPQRIMRGFLTRIGIDHLDTLPELREFADQANHRLEPGRDLYWRNDPHVNVRGNSLLALLVARHILERDLLGLDDTSQRLAAVQEELDNFSRPR